MVFQDNQILAGTYFDVEHIEQFRGQQNPSVSPPVIDEKEGIKSGTTMGTTSYRNFAITPSYNLGLIIFNVVINSSINSKTSSDDLPFIFSENGVPLL